MTKGQLPAGLAKYLAEKKGSATQKAVPNGSSPMTPKKELPKSPQPLQASEGALKAKPPQAAKKAVEPYQTVTPAPLSRSALHRQ